MKRFEWSAFLAILSELIIDETWKSDAF